MKRVSEIFSNPKLDGFMSFNLEHIIHDDGSEWDTEHWLEYIDGVRNKMAFLGVYTTPIPQISIDQVANTIGYLCGAVIVDIHDIMFQSDCHVKKTSVYDNTAMIDTILDKYKDEPWEKELEGRIRKFIRYEVGKMSVEGLDVVDWLEKIHRMVVIKGFEKLAESQSRIAIPVLTKLFDGKDDVGTPKSIVFGPGNGYVEVDGGLPKVLVVTSLQDVIRYSHHIPVNDAVVVYQKR